MSLVTLVSGGLDSSLMALLAKEAGIEQHPLFIDYGQRAAAREWQSCQSVFTKHNLPPPSRMDLSGFGAHISSGLTDMHKRINEDAFLPGRNGLFLWAGAAYACQVHADAVAIGLLDQEHPLFPDQPREFLDQLEACIAVAVGRRLRLVAPLGQLTKGDVLALCRRKGIDGTYSCHSGLEQPCGVCVACLEIARSKEGD